jgi:hypothetical protein
VFVEKMGVNEVVKVQRVEMEERKWFHLSLPKTIVKTSTATKKR